MAHNGLNAFLLLLKQSVHINYIPLTNVGVDFNYILAEGSLTGLCISGKAVFKPPTVIVGPPISLCSFTGFGLLWFDTRQLGTYTLLSLLGVLTLTIIVSFSILDDFPCSFEMNEAPPGFL